MALDPDGSTDATRAPAEPVLYQHTKRPEWGLAILAWDRGTLRAFQFEDGKLRVFKQGYYELVQEVGPGVARAAETVAELERKLGTTRAPGPSSAAATEEPPPSFEDQLRIFAIEYPDGFEDREWVRSKRGEGVGRRLKRHRDAAIHEAQRSLAEERLLGLVDDERYDDLLDDTVAILDSTDLVTRKQVQLVGALAPPRRRAFAHALIDLLYGDSPYQLRFERFVAALSRSRNGTPAWQLITALPGLVHPTDHICVRPASMRKQALQVFPDLAYSNTPNAPLYTRFLDVACRVREGLDAAGRTPRDFLDVHDFVAETLRPSAKKLLEH